MLRLIGIGLTAIVLFAGSAGVSWYLKHLQETKAERETTTTEPETPGHKAAIPAPTSTARHEAPAQATMPSPANVPTAVRAPYNPDAEGAVQIATSLKERLDAVNAREQQITARQKNLDLIFQDIRAERTTIDEKRKQVSALMKKVEEKMTALEGEAKDLKKEQQQTQDKIGELKKSTSEFQNVEKDRIKQMASMYDTMEPASAAKILQTLADSGNQDTAVKILSTMRERQAAKVLAELNDPGLAAELLDRLKGLKKPQVVTPPK